MTQNLQSAENNNAGLKEELVDVSSKFEEYRRKDLQHAGDGDSEVIFQVQDHRVRYRPSTPKTGSGSGEYSPQIADNAPNSVSYTSPPVVRGQNDKPGVSNSLPVSPNGRYGEHSSLPHLGDGNDRQPLPHVGGGNEHSSLPHFGDGNDRQSLPHVGGGNDRQSLPHFGGGNEHQSLPHFGGGNEHQSLPQFGRYDEHRPLPHHGRRNDHQSLPHNGRYDDMQPAYHSYGVGDYERDKLRVPAYQQNAQHFMPPLQRQDAIRGHGAFRQRFGNNFSSRRSQMEARPEKFDGRTSLKEYLVHFESCSQINGWEEGDMATWLAASLKPNVIMALSGDRRVNEMAYEEMVSCLEKRFGPVQSPENYLNELKGRRRSAKESLKEFAQEIRRLASLAYPAFPPDLKDQMARDHFKDAVDDPEIRAAIFRAKPGTLDEALAASLDMESFLRTERSRARGRPPFSRAMQEMVPDDIWWREKMTADIQQLINAQNAQQNRNYNNAPRVNQNNGSPRASGPNFPPGRRQVGVCHHCGDAGHYIKFCPHRGETKNPRNSGNDNRSLQRVMGGPVNTKAEDPSQLEITSQPIASNPSR